MKKLVLIILASIVLPAYALQPAHNKMTLSLVAPVPNTYSRTYSSVNEMTDHLVTTVRNTSYPTQVVRVKGNIRELNMTCEQAFDEIENFYIKHIDPDNFFYNTISYCGYDPETFKAVNFTINSYFDPLNDEAIKKLEKYIQNHNGRKLLGVPFYVERAQAMVVSMNLDAGMQDADNPLTLLRYAHDNSSHFYQNHFDMMMELVSDIYNRFYSTDPAIVLPFIHKWFLTSTLYYRNVLSKSNYAELQPEMIFLMEKGKKIFTPHLRLYYSHHCADNENKYCLS